MKGKVKMKKGIALLLTMAMVVGLSPVMREPMTAQAETTEPHSHSYTNGFCSCGEYEPAELTTDKYDVNNDGECDSVYRISNAGQFNWFAKYVNVGNQSVNAVLSKDIDFGSEKFISIGYSDHYFSGIFDGRGCRITVNQSESHHVAIFGTLGSCTIKNLNVTGKIQTGVQNAAGIAMKVYSGNTANIENCISDVTIESTVEGDGTHGGIIGILSGAAQAVINNCAFTGKITGEKTHSCAGLIGWVQQVANISNSYVYSDFSRIGNDYCEVFCRGTGNVTLTNCYYRDAIGKVPSSGATQMSEEQFASGEVAYRLQGNQEKHVWGQIVSAANKQKHPVIKGTKVYLKGEDSNSVYTNVYDNLTIGDNTIKADDSAYVWYAFTPTAKKAYVFSTTNTKVGQIRINQYFNPYAGLYPYNFSPAYDLNEGETYYVCMSCDAGTYDLKIAEYDKTLKLGENTVKSCINPLWYEFTPDADGVYQFSSTKAASGGGSIYVNTDKSTSGGVNLVNNAPVFELSKGTSYYVMIGAPIGNYDLKIEKLDTTLKVGENTDVKVDGKTVIWYEFTPGTTGTYQFSSTNANGDIYVNTDKSTSGYFYIWNSPTYELKGNTTYYVRMHYNPGSYNLNIKKLNTTLSVGNNTVNGSYSPEIWYEFTPEDDGLYQFSSTDAGDSIYVNTDKGTSGNSDLSKAPVYNLTKDTRYYVRIKYSPGSYNLKIEKLSATLSTGDNTVCVNDSNPIWYEFTPEADGTYVFSSTDATCGIYVNTDQTESNSQGIANSPRYELIAGTKYYVRLYGTQTESYNLKIEKLNTTLSIGDNTVNGSYSPEIWYEFTPETDGVYVFSSTDATCGIYVNTDQTESNSQEIANSPRYELIAGTKYYVRLQGAQPESYNLKIEKLNTTLSTGTNTVCVNFSNPIWYKFTPEEDGVYQFSSVKVSGAIYVNTDMGNNGSASLYNNAPAYELNKDTTYYVRIDYSSGSYNLNIKKLNTTLSTGDNTVGVNLSNTIWYEFKPEADGVYQFSSTDASGAIYVNEDKGTGGSNPLYNAPAYVLNGNKTYYVGINYNTGSYNLKIEKVSSYKVDITSTVDGGDSSDTVALLTGGGLYKVGAEVTVTAPQKAGFTFKGWYKKDGETIADKPQSKKLSYTFTPDSNISLVAVYESNALIALNVNGESDAYSVNGTVQTSNSYNESFKAGSSITVKYTGSGTFCYWKNDSGNIVSRDKEYTFTLVSAITLTAVAVGGSSGTEETGYSALVEFVSSYGQVMQASTWNSKDDGASKTLPAGPSKFGSTFKYWSLDGTAQATATDILAAIDGKASRIEVVPVYDRDTVDYMVRVYYYMYDNQLDTTYTGMKLGDTLTVTARDIEGKVFLYWSGDAEGNSKLSYGQSYFLLVSGNINLYPIYGDAAVEEQPVVAISKVSANTVDSKNKLSFEVTRSIPARYELVEQGVIYATSDTYASNAKGMLIGAEGVYQFVSSDTANNGVFIANMNVTGHLDSKLYVKGYAIVKDTDTGNTETIYTDMAAKSYNELSQN